MREINANDAQLPQRPRARSFEYQAPAIQTLGTVAELTRSGTGQNADATNTATQPGGSGGV